MMATAQDFLESWGEGQGPDSIHKQSPQHFGRGDATVSVVVHSTCIMNRKLLKQWAMQVDVEERREYGESRVADSGRYHSPQLSKINALKRHKLPGCQRLRGWLRPPFLALCQHTRNTNARAAANHSAKAMRRHLGTNRPKRGAY